jgi:putative flippase GtrA
VFNKKWAFNYKNNDNKTLFTKYFLVYTFNLFLGMGVFELVLIMSNIEELLVQAIVIIITAVSNFIGLRKFVFR